MSQQVEFPSIPGTKPKDYPAIIRALLATIERESPNDKELRRYMRSRSFFDKDTAPQLFDLLGIQVSKGQPTTLDTVGKRLHAHDGDAAFKLDLFKVIAERNEVLVKYVFDALEERLYSINEMYRVLTSYVYPGTTVSLVNFKNWMGLIEATGMLKYIGIRWGPSQQVEEVRSYLNGLDIEELLEEEAEGEWEDAEGDLDVALPSEATETTEVASEPEELPDMPDMPPEPTAPPAGTTPAAAAVPLTPAPAASPPTSGATAEPALMPTYRTALRLSSVAEIQEVQKVLELDPEGAELAQRAASLDDAELAHNLEQVKALWGTTTDKRPLGLEHFRIAAREYSTRSRKKGIKTFFLYRALVAASCAFRPVRAGGTSTAPPGDGLDRFRVLEDSGALSRHFQDDQSMDDVVTALVQSGHGGRLDVLAMAPFMILAKQALLGADDWVNEQQKAKAGKAVWEAVYERLYAGVFGVELVWLVREMARNDLWKAEGLKETGVVPTQEVLDVAFRLGLVPTPYLGSFAATLWASRTLTGFCGEELGYEAALLYFGREAMPHSYRGRPWDYFSRDNLRR